MICIAFHRDHGPSHHLANKVAAMLGRQLSRGPGSPIRMEPMLPEELTNQRAAEEPGTFWIWVNTSGKDSEAPGIYRPDFAVWHSYWDNKAEADRVSISYPNADGTGSKCVNSECLAHALTMLEALPRPLLPPIHLIADSDVYADNKKSDLPDNLYNWLRSRLEDLSYDLAYGQVVMHCDRLSPREAGRKVAKAHRENRPKFVVWVSVRKMISHGCLDHPYIAPDLVISELIGDQQRAALCYHERGVLAAKEQIADCIVTAWQAASKRVRVKPECLVEPTAPAAPPPLEKRPATKLRRVPFSNFGVAIEHAKLGGCFTSSRWHQKRHVRGYPDGFRLIEPNGVTTGWWPSLEDMLADDYVLYAPGDQCLDISSD